MPWMRLVALCLVGLVALVASSAELGNTEGMVGARRCAQCHQQAYQVWQRSAHAKAIHALDQKQAKDPRCFQCHGSSQKGLDGIQCESCHGAGQHYAHRYVMRDKTLVYLVGLKKMDKRSCSICHNDNTPSIKAFDYPSMWSPIAHGLDVPEKLKIPDQN